MTKPPLQRKDQVASIQDVRPGQASADDHREALAEAERGHMTRTFKCLDYVFALRSPDVAIVNLLEDIYGACSVPGDPEVWYSIVPVDADAEEQDLFVGTDWLGRISRPAWLMKYLTWHVNRQVIDRSSRFVLLHAAAAEKDGVGILLPAGSEAGKTTLVAGLVRSGCDYLTDEAAAIHPTTLGIEPFPKPLSIDPGSWSALADLAPRRDGVAERYFEDQWQVNAESIRSNAIAGRVAPAIVVFPTYVRGAATVVESVTSADALVIMMQHTFRFHEAGRRNIEVLSRVVRSVRCYRLISGDLDEACAEIQGMIAPDGSRG